MAIAPTRTFMRVRARHLKPGDEIREEGRIPLTAHAVRVYELQGFVTADYQSSVGPGSRTYALTTVVAILRPDEEAH